MAVPGQGGSHQPSPSLQSDRSEPTATHQPELGKGCCAHRAWPLLQETWWVRNGGLAGGAAGLAVGVCHPRADREVTHLGPRGALPSAE